MKTLKNIFAIAILSVIALGVNAQTHANANMSAGATVLSQLTITKNTDVNFGNISSTTPGAVVMNPKTASNDAYLGESATKGKLTIAAANTTSIEINWAPTVTLTNGTPAQDMTLTLDVYGNTTDAAGSSTGITSPANVTTSASGAYFIYVGGSLGTLASQTAGTYTGTANFTVEYN